MLIHDFLQRKSSLITRPFFTCFAFFLEIPPLTFFFVLFYFFTAEYLAYILVISQPLLSVSVSVSECVCEQPSTTPPQPTLLLSNEKRPQLLPFFS